MVIKEVHIRLFVAVCGGIIIGIGLSAFLSILARYEVNPQNIPSPWILVEYALTPFIVGLFIVFMAFVVKSRWLFK